MSDSENVNDQSRAKLEELLAQLEQLSPREIKIKLRGERTTGSQPSELMSRWFKQNLGLAKAPLVKTQQNVDDNLIVEMQFVGYTTTFRFKAGKSVQEYLGIHKPSTSLSISIIADQLTVITGFVEQCGGKEEDVVRSLLEKALCEDPDVIQFIADLREHTEWHPLLREAGVYPADVLLSWDKIVEATKPG